MTTTTTDLREQAAETIAAAEFRSLWPIEVRRNLVRAAQTEGDLPPYAVKATEWALRKARNVERHFDRQVREADNRKGRRFG